MENIWNEIYDSYVKICTINKNWLYHKKTHNYLRILNIDALI